MITVKINVDAVVAEYIRGKYFDHEVGAVRFPSPSDIYITIYDLLAKRPVSHPVDTGNLKLTLPDKRDANEAGGKDPKTYNYISHRAAGILTKRFRRLMWANLHEFVDEKNILKVFNTFYEIIFTNTFFNQSVLKGVDNRNDLPERRIPVIILTLPFHLFARS